MVVQLRINSESRSSLSAVWYCDVIARLTNHVQPGSGWTIQFSGIKGRRSKQLRNGEKRQILRDGPLWWIWDSLDPRNRSAWCFCIDIACAKKFLKVFHCKVRAVWSWPFQIRVNDAFQRISKGVCTVIQYISLKLHAYSKMITKFQEAYFKSL